MRSIRFKVKGHIVEDKLFLKVQEKLRSREEFDIREIKLYLSSIRAGMDKKSPSIVSFYIVGPDDKMDELIDKTLKFMKEYGVEILEREEVPYEW